MVSVSVLIDDVMGGTPLNFKMSDAGYVFNAPVETVVIQHHKDEDKPMKEKEEMRLRVRSAWANGSFYLFTFAVVIAGLGVLARSVPGYTLGIILVAGILFIPIIGGLQLRQDERLSEKSFLELIGISMAQLPLIGKLVKVDKSGKNAKDHLKP
jgi:hypothetical protein